jgi:hypothetical protein
MDFYADYGGNVAPLPFHTLIPCPYRPGVSFPTDARHVRYQLEYNTRSVTTPAGNTYRFQYRKLPPR